MRSAVALAAVLTLVACGADATTAPVESRDLRSASTTTGSTTTGSTSTTAPASPAGELVAPSPADDAGELALRVTAAEQRTRDPDTADAELGRSAFELQVLYRQLARMPEWEQSVVAAVPDPYRLSVISNVAARREFRGLHRRLADELPAWRIVEPLPADTLRSLYDEAEEAFGVPWEVLAAVHLVETGMGRIEGTSSAGAQGPMQFIPSTWEIFGEGDITDPRDSIMAAARYLAHDGGVADLDRALHRYNNSTRYVRGVRNYAAVMTDDPATFRAFHRWQIVFLSSVGDVWLPEGDERTEPVPVLEYLAAHPDRSLGTSTN